MTLLGQWMRWTLLGLFVGLALLVLAPRIAGWRTLTVVSGSMAPTIDAGDVVVARPVAPLSARPGDVITFVDPARRDRLVTHRIMRVTPVGSQVEFVTRGDANTASERWSVGASGTIGRVEYRVPFVGRAFSFASTATGRLALIAVPALVWGVLSLRAIWREATPEVVGHGAA